MNTPSPPAAGQDIFALRWLAIRALGVLGLMLALLLVSDSAAMQAERERGVSSEALELSRAQLRMAMPEGVIRHMRPVLVQGFIDNDHLDLPIAERIVSDILEPQLNASLPLLERAMARIWMSQFTPDEIRDLRAYLQDRSPEKTDAFLDTPLGQKYGIVSPDLDVAESNTLRIWLIKTSRAAFALHPDEMRQYKLDPATGDRLAPPN